MNNLTDNQKEMLKNATYSNHFDGYVLPETIEGVTSGVAADIAEELVNLGYVQFQSDVLTETGVEAHRQLNG